MKYTKIPEWYEDIYNDKFKYGTAQYPNFSMKFARSDPTIYAHYCLGITMRIYQSWILDCITAARIKDRSKSHPGKYRFDPKLQKVIDEVGHDRKKFILCLGRQVGKSTLLKVLSHWAAHFNVFPSGVSNETKVFDISRGDDQAKELLQGIRAMIRQGDMTMAAVSMSTKWHSVTALSQKIIEPNNTQQITFKNGYGAQSFIKSVPPTDAIIGKSADLLIIDEAAKLGCSDPDNWFNEAANPTTTATDGITIINSTPNGQSGYYYELFDPEDKKSFHQYYRIWFPYSINTDPAYTKVAEENKQRLLSEGKRKEWEQEYEAKFTTAVSSFFSSESVDGAVDSSICEVYSSVEPTCIGVDYGMVNSQTVLTISRNLQLLRQHAYEKGDEGLTWFDDICKMVREFNCDQIVVDNCPEGHIINNQLIQEFGEYPTGKVRKVTFRAEKVSMFQDFRVKLVQGKIKLFPCDELTSQMKGMKVEQLKTNISITKGDGMMDDRVDSLVLSMYPSISNEPHQDTGLNYSDPYSCLYEEGPEEYRGDKQWQSLMETKPNLKEMLKQYGIQQ